VREYVDGVDMVDKEEPPWLTDEAGPPTGPLSPLHPRPYAHMA
jgi:hypothetical protein